MLLFQCDVCLFFVAVLNWHWYLLLEAQRTISYRNGFAIDWSNHFLFFVLRAAPRTESYFLYHFHVHSVSYFLSKKENIFSVKILNINIRVLSQCVTFVSGGPSVLPELCGLCFSATPVRILRGGR